MILLFALHIYSAEAKNLSVFRVTSVRYGIQQAAPPFYDGKGPDLVVSGPNVGSNLGSTVLVSGTVCVTNCLPRVDIEG